MLPLAQTLIKHATDTEIDWTSYMQQVELFLGGERNYAKLKGDTGPLVYGLPVCKALRAQADTAGSKVSSRPCVGIQRAVQGDW